MVGLTVLLKALSSTDQKGTLAFERFQINFLVLVFLPTCSVGQVETTQSHEQIAIHDHLAIQRSLVTLSFFSFVCSRHLFLTVRKTTARDSCLDRAKKRKSSAVGDRSNSPIKVFYLHDLCSKPFFFKKKGEEIMNIKNTLLFKVFRIDNIKNV